MQTVPRDWPRRVRLAAKDMDDAGRRQLALEVLVLLRRSDPMDLRGRDMDANAREAHYARLVNEEIRAA